MLKLDLKNKPYWLDLGHGVKLKVRPLTTALMLAARNDRSLVDLVAGDSAPTDAELGVLLGTALARLAILDWEGVGDAKGKPLPVSDAAVNALMDVFPISEAFQEKYLSAGLLMEREKNVSAPLPNGSSAGAVNTARPAQKSAKTVRKS